LFITSLLGDLMCREIHQIPTYCPAIWMPRTVVAHEIQRAASLLSAGINSGLNGDLLWLSFSPLGFVDVIKRCGYDSFLPAPGPGARPKISSILRITAPFDFNGKPDLLPISSIHAAVSSYRLPEVSMVTVPLIW